MDVVEAVREILGLDLLGADVGACREQLARLGRVRSWVQSVEIATSRRLNELATEGLPVEPERELQSRGGRSRRGAGRVKDRSSTLDQFPQMADDLADGAITGEHLDGLHRELQRLAEPERSRFVEREGARLARQAARMSPEAFAKHVRDCVRQAQLDAGVAELERQKRAVRLKLWNNLATGMGNFFGALDAESMLEFEGRIRGIVERLFREAEPEGCPTDPVEKQQYLCALAFISLLDDTGGSEPADG